jgi:hypothetical protein
MFGPSADQKRAYGLPAEQLPIDKDIMFSNHRGEYKKGIEKRQIKLLEKLSFIKPFLAGDEKILLITTGYSPISVLEHFLTGWMVFYLKQSLLVFTNKRIFHVPTAKNYSYRNSIARIFPADCKEIKMKMGRLDITYQNGKKEKFNIGGGERKKIGTLIPTISQQGLSGQTGGRTHLCPRCTRELVHDEYTCPNCRLEFKTKADARRISIVYPGGGYFYTGHPWLGLSYAIAESIFFILIVALSFDAAKGGKDAVGALVGVAIFIIIEKAISVYHSNHFIKEYIPKEKKIVPTL